MLRIKNKAASPKGGFTVYEPGVPTPFKGPFFGYIVRQIKLYREANNLPVAGLSDEIETRICAERPEICWDEPAPQPEYTPRSLPAVKAIPPSRPSVINVPEPKRPNLIQAAGHAAKSLAKWAALGFPQIPQDVFEQRKVTCIQCDRFKAWSSSDPEAGICTWCRCPTGRRERTLKLRIPHEHCPLEKWKAWEVPKK